MDLRHRQKTDSQLLIHAESDKCFQLAGQLAYRSSRQVSPIRPKNSVNRRPTAWKFVTFQLRLSYLASDGNEFGVVVAPKVWTKKRWPP